MTKIELRNISKIYKGSEQKAVNNFSMTIENGEFIVFVGPSGCGKSTTLRMIAGLEEITEGKLLIDEKYMNDTEPKDRDLAMVFQNYALYPYLNVYDNIAFGLRLRKVNKEEIDQKVKAVAELLGIEDLLKRKPKALSGGQRQRVALGRAIVRDAKAYLLDEPLSNLDAKLRGSMRVEIINLYHTIHKTFIYVTHDQVEAMTMGTRIVVMNRGEVQQISDPETLYDKPVNKFVASFIGTPQMNFMNGILNGNKVKLDLMNEEFVMNGLINTDNQEPNLPVTFGIRSEDVHVTDDKKGYPAMVSLVEMLGSETLVYFYFGNEVNKRYVLKSIERLSLKPKDTIYVYFDLAKAHLFDEKTEISLLYQDNEKNTCGKEED